MVVDDDSAIRRLVVTTFQPLGYRILEASGGEEALSVSDTFDDTIDLLLTDVMMPGMDGLKLSNALLARRPTIKTLFMSGYENDIIANGGVLDDSIFFVQKPITPTILSKKLRQVLDDAMEKDEKVITPMLVRKQTLAKTNEKGNSHKTIVFIDAELKDITPQYLQDRLYDVAILQKALHESDHETIRTLGHRMTGSGGGYGFHDITEIGLHIERAAKERKDDDIREWTARLLRYLNEVEVTYGG